MQPAKDKFGPVRLGLEESLSEAFWLGPADTALIEAARLAADKADQSGANDKTSVQTKRYK